MSLSLTGRKRKDTFTWLLQAQGAGPLDATSPRVICLGDGTPTPLSVTQTGVFVAGNSVSTARTLVNTYFIDSTLGNDSTAGAGRADLPYRTLNAAYMAAYTAGVADWAHLVLLDSPRYGGGTLTLTEWSDDVILHITGTGEDLCGLSVSVTGKTNASGTTGYNAPAISLFLSGITANVSSAGGPGTGVASSPGNSGQISITGGACSRIVTPNAALPHGLYHTFTGVRFVGILSSFVISGASQFTGCDLTWMGMLPGASPQDMGGNYAGPISEVINAAIAANQQGLIAVSSVAYPVVGRMYVTTDTCQFYDPTARQDGSALQAGDSYLVLVQGNNSSGATQYNVAIFSDITMAPSIYPLYRTYDGSAWGSVHSADNTPVWVQPIIPANFTLGQKHNGKIIRVAAAAPTITLPSASWTGPFNCRIIYEGTPSTYNFLTFAPNGNTIHSKNNYKKCKTQYGEMFVTLKAPGLWQISGDLTDL